MREYYIALKVRSTGRWVLYSGQSGPQTFSTYTAAMDCLARIKAEDERKAKLYARDTAWADYIVVLAQVGTNNVPNN